MSHSFLTAETTISSCTFSSSPLLNAGHILSPRVKASLPISRRSRLPSLVIRCNGGKDDSFYMRRCVELARKAVGCTSPNPMVGCVIVKDGEIVGEGFHPKAGQPHAEVFALKDAGTLAENATAYVSLEPCNHYGRTPPCTEALIRARVKKVVVGMIDPNPIVASKGVDRLRESGIDVTVGVEEKLCRKLNEAFIHRMVTGKPFVAMTYSLSMNGRISTLLGRGVEETGDCCSQLLQEYDGVIISSEILGQISSFPLSHESVLNQPQYMIIVKDESSVLHLPNLIKGSETKIVILAEKAIKLEPETNGVEMAVLEKLNLSSVIDFCASRGLCSILLDLRGGSGGLGELMVDELGEKLIQKVVVEVCPIWSKETSVLSFGQNLQKLKNLEARISKESVIIEGYM